MLFEEKKKKFKNTLYWIYYSVWFQDLAAMMLCSYKLYCSNDIFFVLDYRCENSRS